MATGAMTPQPCNTGRRVCRVARERDRAVTPVGFAHHGQALQAMDNSWKIRGMEQTS